MQKTIGERRYRVEHRDGGEAVVLARECDVVPHHAALVPYLASLWLDGTVAGEVVLVEEATDAVVARRRFGTFRHRWARPHRIRRH